MISKVRRMCFVIVVMLVLIAGFTSARAAEDHNFTVQCADIKNTCTTTFLKGHTEVACSYPPADWKSTPVYANMVVIYKCNLIISGTKSWKCKGFIGAMPDLKATFTIEEFQDKQLRCDKICTPCSKGWQ